MKIYTYHCIRWAMKTYSFMGTAHWREDVNLSLSFAIGFKFWSITFSSTIFLRKKSWTFHRVITRRSKKMVVSKVQ